jgi:hypothetical protein
MSEPEKFDGLPDELLSPEKFTGAVEAYLHGLIARQLTLIGLKSGAALLLVEKKEGARLLEIVTRPDEPEPEPAPAVAELEASAEAAQKPQPMQTEPAVVVHAQEPAPGLSPGEMLALIQGIRENLGVLDQQLVEFERRLQLALRDGPP